MTNINESKISNYQSNLSTNYSSSLPIQSSSDEIKANEGPKMPSNPPEGLEKDWIQYLSKAMGGAWSFENYAALLAFFEASDGKSIDYEALKTMLKAMMAPYQNTPAYKQKLDAILSKIEQEQSIWKEYGQNIVNEEIDRITKLINSLRNLTFLSPAQRAAAEGMIALLAEQKNVLNHILNDEGTDVLKKFQDNEKTMDIIKSRAETLLENLAKKPDDGSTNPGDSILPPNHDIPLEDGETVRNQKPKGQGIGRVSGASNYLKAFFAFSQTCNKLITMNAAWGIQLGELQKAATKLSLSGQEALNKLINKEVDNFNDKSPHQISKLQGWISQLQNDFGAYQKKLDTVMPLILEQPKNITKDLDKFLEAAKSILQLVTAYANFRI